jgi:hypothetical protein
MRFARSRRMPFGVLVAWLVLAQPDAAAAQALGFQGQLSGWFILNDQRPSTPVLSVRYLPTLRVEQPLPAGGSVDVELSVSAYAPTRVPAWRDVDSTATLRPYRAWARYRTSRFEARVGLQQINFGAATLLRPLMWFDSVDPRDPLQLTPGVYAALLRYYFQNNVSVWAWGLYGNERVKGWETNPAREDTPELGARVQVPLPRGELAFTTHQRRADLSRGLVPFPGLTDPEMVERRYALDGKWDAIVGVWFEGVWTRQTHQDLRPPDQGALNVGADYTFGVGNGLHVLGEYFVLEYAWPPGLATDPMPGFETRPDGAGVPPGVGTSSLWAASVRYPLGLLDTLAGIVYVDATRDAAYRFVSWQRSYDRWQFYVMGFWNPADSAVYQSGSGEAIGQNPLIGRGVQIMAVFNH